MLLLLAWIGCSQPDVIETVVNTSAYDSSGQINEIVAWTELVPTVIYLNWRLAEPANSWVEFRSLPDQQWQATPVKPITTGYLSSAILGVAEDTAVEFRVISVAENQMTTSTTATVTTPSFLERAPRPRLSHADQQLQAGFNYILGGVSNQDSEWFIYAADRTGSLVWLVPLKDQHWGLTVKLALEGTSFLFNDSPAWGDGVDVATVLRASADLSTWEKQKVPGQNHSFTEVPGGMVWSKPDGETEDVYQQLKDSNNHKLWDASSWFESKGLEPENASNAINWLPKSDSLLFSLYNRHSIVEIDRASGEVLRLFGQLPGAYNFDPPNSIFNFQHHPTLTVDGNLLLTSTPYPNKEGDETIAIEYQIDDDNKSLTMVWSYGEGLGLLAEQIGEARRLKNGNTLINYGTNTQVREVTNEGVLAWEMVFDDAKAMGSTVPIDNLYDLCPRC